MTLISFSAYFYYFYRAFAFTVRSTLQVRNAIRQWWDSPFYHFKPLYGFLKLTVLLVNMHFMIFRNFVILKIT